MIDINLDISSALAVLDDFSALDSVHSQSMVTQTVKRYVDPYTPMQTGILIHKASVGRKTIEYNEPYAQFVWFGKLMLGEESHSPFAKNNEKKYVTNADLSYHDEPKRGAYWVDRMWAEQEDKILDDITYQLLKEEY